MEASGDETESHFEILANAKNNQSKLHAEYGGVYPNMAKNEHIKHLPLLLDKVLKESGVEKPDVVMVTYGPGLEPSLWTGITFAQELVKKWEVPLVPVNHMEGHILSVFGKDSGEFVIPKTEFPVLSLLVSGGHTQLIVSESWKKHKIIGSTLDDAVGEAFDKVARMLGLPYPGGPHISRLAEKARTLNSFSFWEQFLQGLRRLTSRGRSQIFQQKNGDPGKISSLKNNIPISLPRPMIHSKDYNFSFSGLKTASLYLIEKLGELTEEKKEAVALEFENAVTETLIKKTGRAIEEYGVRTLIVGGGVACNTHIQREMRKAFGDNMKVLFPTPALATDNSIMIGMSGYLEFLKMNQKGVKPEELRANGSLKLS